MACPVKTFPNNSKTPGRVRRQVSAPKKLKPLAKKPTRKDAEAACSLLGLILEKVIRVKLAALWGQATLPSRQTVWSMRRRNELVAGVTVAGLSTITAASWENYQTRYAAGLV